MSYKWMKQLKSGQMRLDQLDAAENIFFGRELEAILKEQFNQEYATLMGRQMVQCAPFEVERHKKTFTYRSFKSYGKAKEISDDGDDLPAVGLSGTETTGKIKAYGASFGYSIDELEAAAALGRPLDSSLAVAARDTLEQYLDDIIAIGDPNNAQVLGLLNQSNTLTATPKTKAATGTTWCNPDGTLRATSDEILGDLNAAAMKAKVATKEVEMCRRIVMPTLQYVAISTNPRSSTSDTTILEFFLANHKGMEVMSWERIAAAGAAGADRLLAYDPNPRKVRCVLPVDFEMQAPQLKNYRYRINCRLKTGGVYSPYPNSIVYMDGI
jgi:hypothetical protein